MAYPNRSQRGYADLPFPRRAVTNFGVGGSLNTGAQHYLTETIEQFSVAIAASGSVNLVPLRQALEDQILLVYLNITQMQVDALLTGNPLVAGQVLWPGWWSTNVGTSLTAALNTTGGTGISMSVSGQPPVGYFGHQPNTLNANIVTTGSPVASTWTTVKRFDAASSSWTTPTAYTNGASVIVDSGANFEVVVISSVSTTSTSVTFTATYTKTHLAGVFVSLLPFPVLISNSDDHSRDEVVLVTGQTAATTYTISRGTTGTPVWGTPYGGAANPPAHIVGDRVATLVCVPSYVTAFYLNIARNCPPCPIVASSGVNQNGMRWGDYVAVLSQGMMSGYTFTDIEGNVRDCADGMFYDSADWALNPNPPWVDADQNNAVDPIPGDGPSFGPVLTDNQGLVLKGIGFGHGIIEGVRYAVKAVRNLTTHRPLAIMTNGTMYAPYGKYFENTQAETASQKVPGLFLYRMQQAAAVHPIGSPMPVSVFNYELLANNLASTQTIAGQSSASPVYQNIRLYMTAVLCLTDGAFCFDFGSTTHGQPYVVDEEDMGAGTALTVALTAGATSLQVNSTTPFQQGDTVKVPLDYVNGTNVAGEEAMTVGTITDATHMNVTRGITYGGNVQTKGVAQVGAKVRTLAQQRAGKGWMGRRMANPLDNFAGLGANLFANSDFTNSAAVSNSYPPQVTFNSWTLAQNQAGASATAFLMAETGNPHSGPQCVKLQVITPTYINPFSITFTQALSGLSLASGQAVTFSVWARGDASQPQLQLFVKDTTNTQNVCSAYLPLTHVWTRYWVVFYIGQNGAKGATYAGTFPVTNLNCQVCAGANSGNVWIDDIAMQVGDVNLLQADFQNAYAICNATQVDQVVTLPAITNGKTSYRTIKGQQDPTVNNDTIVTSVTVLALSGLILRKV